MAQVTAGQLALAGRSYVREYVRTHGGEIGAGDLKDAVDGLTKALVAAARCDDFEAVYVVNDNVINAMSVPPGSVVVNAGLLQASLAFAEKKYGTGNERDAGFAYMVAGALAHELAHLKLGHSLTLLNSRLSGNAKAAFSRDQELAADQAAALVLINSGFRMQGLEDTLEMLDATDKTISSDYNSDHDLPAARRGNLLILKGNLLKYQATYNNAIANIVNASDGESLKASVEELDAMNKDLPVLAPYINHAIATAYFKAWVLSAQVEDLVLQPDMGFYAVSLSDVVRGKAGDPGLLNSAIKLFSQEVELAPWSSYSLAQLALLEAYADQKAAASKHATAALANDPTNCIVLNNAGAVLFREGNFSKAAKCFEDSRRFAIANEGLKDYLPAVYNLAHTKVKTGDLKQAQALYKAYAQYDADSSWARSLAKAAKCTAADTSKNSAQSTVDEQAKPAAKAASTLVTEAAGVSLGMTYAEAAKALGPPDESTTIGNLRALNYTEKGVTLTMDKQQNIVNSIFLRSPYSQNVGPVKLGMDQTSVVKALGKPLGQLDGGWFEYARQWGFNVSYAANPKKPNQTVLTTIWVLPVETSPGTELGSVRN